MAKQSMFRLGGRVIGMIAPLLVGSLAIADQAKLHQTIDQQAEQMESRVIAWRRDLHKYPELSNREFRTSAIVAKHLKSLGMEVETNVGHTGVVGILKGGKGGPTIALRADMDGLPVEEQTGLPYASKEKSTYNGNDVGVMHACGHDNHVAILMGAAEVLAGMREDLSGTIKFIFQPAEEGAPAGEEGGAGLMIKEGVLKNPDVEAIFGLHISQRQSAGQASYRALGMMASAQSYTIKVNGRQTHGAMPWAGVDPIVIGAQIVSALQTIVSRNINVTAAPAVVTVGTFHSGVRSNIIPDAAELSGTIRTFDPADRISIGKRITSMAKSIGESMGAEVTVEIDPGVPVTFNHEGLTKSMVPSLQRVYTGNNLIQNNPTTGAEDFAFYQEEIPGLFFFIGGRPADILEENAIPNHSPLFYVDEDALVFGVRAMSSLAVDYMEANQ